MRACQLQCALAADKDRQPTLTAEQGDGPPNHRIFRRLFYMFKIDRQRIALSAVLIALTMAPGFSAAQTRAKTPIDSIVALVEEDVILRSADTGRHG
jgi:hypothetical protein